MRGRLGIILGFVFLMVLVLLLVAIKLHVEASKSEPHVITVPAHSKQSWPFVINTWAFTNATARAWDILNNQHGSSLDAVEEGCSMCEVLQCDGSVGYGGSPDENGETTLDAMIMDGTTHDVGAVAALRRVKSAISVARKLMEHTSHTFLVGDQATEFALMMGFTEESLTTSASATMYKNWKTGSCQPNYWKNVVPNPSASCGPYQPEKNFKQSVDTEGKNFNIHNHDTVGMIAIDVNGHIAGGASTNGASHKIPGRVGDSPIPGSGAYVDRAVGGAAATGDGDIMMRFMPALIAVEGIRSGLGAHEAAKMALARIASYYPKYMGAIVATNTAGEFGAACHGFKTFPYSVASVELGTVTVMSVDCFA